MDISLKKIVKEAKKDKRVLAIVLFGSSLKGKGRDIDICIFLKKKYSNHELSKIRLKFLRKTQEKIDIQIFQQLPLYIRIRIFKENKMLYCKNEDKMYEIAFKTIKEFGFFKKVYQMYLKEVKNG